ncbi:MAG: isopeptide-forming domain-containing fimbrial protein [Firmicutes bacterium]|nr:isopeptide-forming domain-containing fimbrial protein [Bacillota bacterium]
MKQPKKFKLAFTVLLAMILTLAIFTVASAAEKADFPLIALNGDLVADANTQYVIEYAQDPATKFITATLKITNGTSGATARPLIISGVAFEMSFDSRVSLYRYNPLIDGDNHPYDASRMYSGVQVLSDVEFRKYCNTPITGFKTIGSNAFQNNTAGRYIGATITAENEKDIISIAPGATVTVAQVYFMSTNGTDVLDLDMFRFDFLNNTNAPGLRLIRLSNWLGNGTFFLVGDRRSTNSGDTYIVNKLTPATLISQSFKLHVVQAPPVGLSAKTDPPRAIVGYNNATMEWSYDAAGPYTAGAPTIKDEAHTIYVRYRETAYSGNDAVYGNYKKYLASEPVAVIFPPTRTDVVPQATKTAQNLTSTDGRIHVGDTLLYTITAKNAGDQYSNWTDVKIEDTLPAGVTFAAEVTLDGTPLSPGTGYVFSAGKLTVPVGNIIGGAQKVVTFKVTVNADAYGASIKNSVSVSGKDGDDDKDITVTEPGDPKVVDRSQPPTIDPITAGDRTITGTGVAGSQITVTLPDNSTLTATVAANGTWSVDVPTGKNLEAGQKVTAVQKTGDLEPSIAVETTVLGRPDGVLDAKKTSANITRQDGTLRVGDTIEYTITAKNSGPAKSLLVNIPIVDALPTEVDFVANSVMINGVAAGSAATYNPATHTLTVALGNLESGEEKIVTFRTVINETAYGKSFQNTAKVGDKDIIDDPKPPVIDRSIPPTFDEINAGDRKVSGHGVVGSTITVTFPNSTTTATATVAADSTWSVDVPTSINLVVGDIVKAVQKTGTLDPSVPAEEVVKDKKPVIPDIKKVSENKTHTDGTTHVNDVILYTITIRNLGEKSIWTNVYVVDEIPAGLTLNINTILLDGKKPTFSSFENGILQVYIENDVPYGVVRVVSFECAVKADAYGLKIKNIATVTGKENGGDEKKEDVEDEEERDVFGKSDVPTIDDVYRDDTVITGTGEPDAEITVILKDGTELKTKVKPDKTWSVDVPPGKEPQTGDIIKAIQTEPGKDPSDPVTTIVKDKNYRAVHGFVWPMVVDDLSDLGVTGFLEMHAITVELRPTFRTAADPALSTKAVVVGNPLDEKGEFTITNVPFGQYVLYIHRPGYLARAMNITISASDPDIIELTPPGQADNGVFNLWWGDCNGDLLIENRDVMMIIELMDMNVDVFDDKYNPACDLNADGVIESKDVMRVLEMWNRDIWDYAGADDIDIFS